MLHQVVKNAVLSLLLAWPCLAGAGDAHWIDVRTAGEYADGHVSQAVNIPYEEITQRIGEVTTDRDALIYVYCRSGRRSGIAKGALEQAGFTNVVNLGGLDDARRAAAQLTAAEDKSAGD